MVGFYERHFQFYSGPLPAPRGMRLRARGVRDRSPDRSATPEPSGRPRGCSLIAPFPARVDDMTRTGDPGRHGLLLSPGTGPPGRGSRPGAGLGGEPLTAADRLGARSPLPDSIRPLYSPEDERIFPSGRFLAVLIPNQPL
jgi:hypothetical protein